MRGFVLGKAHTLLAALRQVMVVLCRLPGLVLLVHWAVFHVVMRLCRAGDCHSHNRKQCEKSPFHFFLSSSLCSLRCSPGDIIGEILRMLSGWLATNISSRPAGFPGAVDLSFLAQLRMAPRNAFCKAARSAIRTSRAAAFSTASTCTRWHGARRSEEHTSELQSHLNLVCRLLLEKKKKYPPRANGRPSTAC